MGDQGSSLKVSIRQLTCGVCSPGHTEPPAAPPTERHLVAPRLSPGFGGRRD